MSVGLRSPPVTTRQYGGPMRLLAIGNLYPPHHFGGYELVWRGAMQYVRGAGHAVRVLTTTYRRADVCSDTAEESEVYRELDWYWHEHEWRRLGLLERLRLERHNARLLERHLDEFEPDLVAWWPVGGLSLSLIEHVRRMELPSLLFAHDPWLRYGPERDLWLSLWRRFGPAAVLGEWLTGLPTRVDFDRAGRWLFCSRSLCDDARDAGLRSGDVTVVHPGVDGGLLAQRREASYPPWRWRLLYVGRVVAQKGIDTAIASLPLLPLQARIEIVGDDDGGCRQELERLAVRLQVRDRVHFKRSVSRKELVGLYRAADAIVFPVKWHEPWGLVPLEAMALGRPVLASGRGGSREYLVEGSNALMFDADDPGTLAAAARRLADDAELRQRLRHGGYRTAQRYSEDQFNRRVLEETLRASKARSSDR
jgi:glycosyltransferase involved in cell wall biosynthesis